MTRRRKYRSGWRDAYSPSPDSFVSFRVPSVVTQYEHHVKKEKDTEDVILDLKLAREDILGCDEAHGFRAP